MFPFIPTQSKILVCRLVCKRWRNGVDNFLESNSSRRPVYNMDTPQHKRLGIQTIILKDRGLLRSLFTLEKIRQIPEKVFPFPIKNPIVGRSIEFSLKFVVDEKYSSALEFFCNFGHHIWDVYLLVSSRDPLKLFQLLKKTLEYLPNLKRLKLCFSGETNRRRLDFAVSEFYYEHKHTMNLPPLPFLETLELAIYDNHRRQIMEIFLMSYPSIRLGLNMRYCCIPASIKLDQLTELTISIDCETQLETFQQQQFKQMKRLAIFLVQRISNGCPARDDLFPDLFQAIQLINDSSFSQNLSCLFIEFPRTDTLCLWNSQGPFPILELPNLKTLELREGKFNLICRVDNLEYLHVHAYEGSFVINGFTCGHGTLEENDFLDLKDLHDNPTKLTVESVYRSKLWKVLPRLKHCTVGGTSEVSGRTVHVEQGFRRNFVKE